MTSSASQITGGSKASQLRDLLYDQILGRGFQPGDKLWTEAELIQGFGVSVTTVRKALDDLVRQGVVERRVGKGTFLKSLPGQESRRGQAVLMLAFMSQTLMSRDAYFSHIVASMEQAFTDAEQRFVVMSGNWGQFPQEEMEGIRTASPRAIVLPYSSADEKPFVAQLVALGLPLVLLNSPLPGAQAVQIVFDDYAGGAQAAEYLLAKGYRRFGVVSAPVGSLAGEERVQAFMHTVQRHSEAKVVAQVTPADYSQLAGYEYAAPLLASARVQPDVIFCASDLQACGVIQHLSEAGLRVPGDVAVMGFGDFVKPPLFPTQLTTMHMDLEKFGKLAAQAILDLPDSASGVSEQIIRLPLTLVEGETA